jgi:hypothetical protein
VTSFVCSDVPNINKAWNVGIKADFLLESLLDCLPVRDNVGTLLFKVGYLVELCTLPVADCFFP